MRKALHPVGGRRRGTYSFVVSLRELILGKPLRNDEEQVERVRPVSAIPAMGLDALASAAYGPEAALTVLLPLGHMAPRYIVGISVAVVAVLSAVYCSYRQTIAAYPDGGGAYTVAKDNLGPHIGLLAATALCVDYILNVTVAISAGVGAIASAVPALLPKTLSLGLVILLILTVVNLRGVRSAGVAFMAPTYLFIAVLGVSILLGIAKVVVHGQAVPAVPPVTVPATMSAAGAWLLLRSFASGCTALTGVEAVSNAIPVFREPKAILARRTLASIVSILAYLLLGVAVLSRLYGISATPPGQNGYQSVLSQMIAAVAGRGPFYYLAMAAVLMVLALSANTSFTDFPRVCRLLAQDAYLPAGFAHRGRRLVYTHGIVALALLSACLLIAFQGITDRLIPLFAVGAFTAFTLSQLGMVMRWRRVGGPTARRSMLVNGLGAFATAATLGTIVISKFTEGAWLTILSFPLLWAAFVHFRRHQECLERQLVDEQPLSPQPVRPPMVVVPLRRLDRVAHQALHFGMSISPEVEAVQVRVEDLQTQSDLSRRWEDLVERPLRAAGRQPPRLVIIPSPYREHLQPIIDHVLGLADRHQDRVVAVVLPEVVERRWYHFLTSQSATLLTQLLLWRGDPRVVVVNAPWYVKD
jgi:amino acid transporter